MGYDKSDTLKEPQTWFFVSLFCGIIAFIFYFSITNYKVSDLIVVEGVVKHYKFIDNSDHTLMSTFNIQLKNRANIFQVLDYNRGSFKKESFEKQVRKGDTISLSIPKELLDMHEKEIPVYEIKKGKTYFLNKEESISDYDSTRIIYFWVGIILTIIGVSWYIFKFLKK
jgi:hypothetical protein